MPSRFARFTVDVPKAYDEAERERLASLIIEYIQQRTEAGKDVNGKRFPKYSKSYMESLDFKNAGKTGNVDLTLSGDMLASIEVIKSKRGKLTIGIADDELSYRAEGNILGSYGGDPNPKKARNFLGLKDSELKRILDQYGDEFGLST